MKQKNVPNKRQRTIDWNCYELQKAGFDFVKHSDGIMLRGSENTWIWIPVDSDGRIQDFKEGYDYIVVTEMPKNPSEAKRLMDKNDDDIHDILEGIDL